VRTAPLALAPASGPPTLYLLGGILINGGDTAQHYVDVSAPLAALNASVTPKGSYWEVLVVTATAYTNVAWNIQIGEADARDAWSAQQAAGNPPTDITGTPNWIPPQPDDGTAHFHRLLPHVRASPGYLPLGLAYAVLDPNTDVAFTGNAIAFG